MGEYAPREAADSTSLELFKSELDKHLGGESLRNSRSEAKKHQDIWYDLEAQMILKPFERAAGKKHTKPRRASG